MESFSYPAGTGTARREAPTSKSTQHDELQPFRDMLCYAKDYAKENPEVAALTCLGVGFILGWKMKMW